MNRISTRPNRRRVAPAILGVVRQSSKIIPQSPNKASMVSKPVLDTRDARVLTFWRRVNRCHECPSIAPWRKFPLGRRGTTRFGLMILGEAPVLVSLENGRPFSNPPNLVIRLAFARLVAPR